MNRSHQWGVGSWILLPTLLLASLWSCQEIFTAFRFDPGSQGGFPAFVLWILSAFAARFVPTPQPENTLPSACVAAVLFLLSVATEINLAAQFAFVFSVSAFIPSRRARLALLLSGFSWIPATGWFAPASLLPLLPHLRVLLAVVGMLYIASLLFRRYLPIRPFSRAS